MADAPPAGELAGERDEGARRVSRAVLACRRLSGEGFAPHQFVRELYDNSPPSASVGVLCTFLPGEQAEFAGRLNPQARRELRSSREWRSSSARRRSRRRMYIETDWSAEEWTRGAYASTFVVGGLTRFGADMRRPVGPDPVGVLGHLGVRTHAHGGRRPLGRGGRIGDSRFVARGLGSRAGRELSTPGLGRATARLHDPFHTTKRRSSRIVNQRQRCERVQRGRRRRSARRVDPHRNRVRRRS